MTATASTDSLRWRLGVWLPHELATTTNARRLASLRRQEREMRAELANREAIDACSSVEGCTRRAMAGSMLCADHVFAAR